MEQIVEKQLLIQVTARFKETEVQGHWDSNFQWNHALTNLCYNKVLGITNDIINIFAPVIVKSMEKNLNIMNPCFRNHILPVPWPYLWNYIRIPNSQTSKGNKNWFEKSGG